MNIIKNLVFVLLVLSQCIAIGQRQDDKSQEYYKKGIKFLKKGNYKEADSLLTLSASLREDPDVYFNLALAKYYLGNKCGYCENMKKVADFGDAEGKRLYQKNCTKVDSIIYSNTPHPDSSFYSLIITTACTNERVQIFYIKNLRNDELTSFRLKEDVMTGKEQYFSSFPGLESITTDNIIYTGEEVMPSYTGGDDARVKFLAENLVYPEEALKNHIEGTVYVNFVIEPDGSISNVKILKGIGGGCDEEALRLIKLMPKWNPGKVGNFPVRVEFNMPFRFAVN